MKNILSIILVSSLFFSPIEISSETRQQKLNKDLSCYVYQETREDGTYTDAIKKLADCPTGENILYYVRPSSLEFHNNLAWLYCDFKYPLSRGYPTTCVKKDTSGELIQNFLDLYEGF